MTERSITAARARRRLGAAAVVSTLVAGGLLATHLSPTNAATGTVKLTKEQIAEALLTRRGDHMSAAATAYLRYLTGRNRPEGLRPENDAPAAAARAAAPSGSAAASGPSGMANVRVNDPATDTFLEQTTQSETTLAVAGRNVAVGFNDSQHVYPGGFLTAAANITGYAYSTDGGRSFTDGGNLPSAPGQIHFGDPWLGADRAGTFYFADLSLSGESGGLEVAVATSTNGGKVWSGPVYASPDDPALFYQADKDALTVGRAKSDPAKDTVYVSWDDFVADAQGNVFSGLPVARSQDGGKSFQLAYADKIDVSDPNSCSFGSYIGAQPIVDPATGDLVVSALRTLVDDPTCSGGTEKDEMVAVRSTDGGQTFGTPVVMAPVAPTEPFVDLGPGKIARAISFPTLAFRGGKLYAAWNEGTGGAMHVVWTSSRDGGVTWGATAQVPVAAGEDFQPALSADGKGLHLAYYHKNPDLSVDVLLADSASGSTWSTKRVTTTSFPGVLNNPQFDPVIAPGYMGDYIANVATGGSVYLSWGDNRDIVKNALWQNGRNDPDVFFAKR